MTKNEQCSGVEIGVVSYKTSYVEAKRGCYSQSAILYSVSVKNRSIAITRLKTGASVRSRSDFIQCGRGLFATFSITDSPRGI